MHVIWLIPEPWICDPLWASEKVSDIAAMMDSTHADCDPKGVHSGEDGDLPCFNVIVPTLNAAASWNDFASALLRCVTPSQILILDSASADGTPELARPAGSIRTFESRNASLVRKMSTCGLGLDG